MPIRRPDRRRNRTALDPSNRPAGTDTVATNSVSANKWRMVFTLPIILNALPTDFKVAGASPTAITQVNPFTYDLTFAVNVAAGQAFVIPGKSLNIRTRNGGYVAAAAGTF